MYILNNLFSCPNQINILPILTVLKIRKIEQDQPQQHLKVWVKVNTIWQAFSVKGQTANIYALWAIWFLTFVGKVATDNINPMGMAVFQ